MYPHTRTIKTLEDAYRKYQAKQNVVLVQKDDKHAVARIGDEVYRYSFMDATWQVTETSHVEYDSPNVSIETEHRLNMLLKYNRDLI